MLNLEHLKGTLYCTKETEQLLLYFKVNNKYKYRHLKGLIRSVDWSSPVELKVGPETIQMTFIPAHHCPGSAMFSGLM